MFKAILTTQWQWSRLTIVLASLASFAVPVLSVQEAGNPSQSEPAVGMLLTSMRTWSLVYPILALVIALAVAVTAWGADHRGRHVYALSLPIPRWQYALYRFGAGLVLIAVPCFAVWLGAVVATKAAIIPSGLTTYVVSLTLRFALATLLANAIFFAISAGTNRTAGYVLATIAGLVVAQIVLASAVDYSLVENALELLGSWPGPFEIYAGRWMLIDV